MLDQNNQESLCAVCELRIPRGWRQCPGCCLYEKLQDVLRDYENRVRPKVLRDIRNQLTSVLCSYEKQTTETRQLMRSERGQHQRDLRTWITEHTNEPAQQEPDADPPVQEDNPPAQEAPTHSEPDHTNRPANIVKMRRVPRRWSAIWDPSEDAHWYWERDTGVTTWDLSMTLSGDLWEDIREILDVEYLQVKYNQSSCRGSDALRL